MLAATQASELAGIVDRRRQQQPPRAGRRLLGADLAAAHELEHDARLAQRVVQALGAGHERRQSDRGPRAQARGDALRRRRRGAPGVVGRAGREQRPRHAVLLQRERGGELLGDGGDDPAGAVGLLGAQRDRAVRQRPRVGCAIGVGVGEQSRRVGAGALAQRPHQRGRRRLVPGASRTRASATSAVRACRSPRGAPGGAS